MRDFNDILDEGMDQQTRLLSEAFEAGRATGRQEASVELRQKLGALLGDDTVTGAPVASSPVLVIQSNDDIGDDDGGAGTGARRRAPPGSVKPAIAELVNGEPGLTAEEIKDRTGIKKNSVRGTLWLLSTEGSVERREGRWYPVAQTNEAVGTNPQERMPTASITGTEKGASDQNSPGLEEPERLVVDDNMS